MNVDFDHPPELPPLQYCCEDCKSYDKLILHNVARLLRSQPQKLCTSCVLRFYHKSFCAECFEIYDESSLNAPPFNPAMTPGNGRLLTCIRCDNWSHATCPKANTPRSPYLCPVCSPGNFRYFDSIKTCRGDGYGDQAIGKDEAKSLYTAAKLSVITMNRAAAGAKLEVERKVKESALAKKRALEAIEYAFSVDGLLDKEVASPSTVPVASSSAEPRFGNYTLVRNGVGVVIRENANVGPQRNGGGPVIRGNANGKGAVSVAAGLHFRNSINGRGSGSGENAGGCVRQGG